MDNTANQGQRELFLGLLDYYKFWPKNRYCDNEIIAVSESMKKVADKIKHYQDNNIPVLIYGAQGSGKRLAARTIHYRSSRASAAFIEYDCAAPGKFDFDNLAQIIEDGTLYLSHIGFLPLDLQKKLFELIKNGAAARFIASSASYLRAEVSRGKFLEKLYDLLVHESMQIPPLAERKEDLLLLVDFFVKKLNKKYNKRFNQMDESALACFLVYPWPGQVTELQQVLERMVMLYTGNVLKEEYIPVDILTNYRFIIDHVDDYNKNEANPYKKIVDGFEKIIFSEFMTKYRDNMSKFSRAINVHRNTILNKSYEFKPELRQPGSKIIDLQKLKQDDPQ